MPAGVHYRRLQRRGDLGRRRHCGRGAHPLHAERPGDVGVVQCVANGVPLRKPRRDRADKAIAGASGIDNCRRTSGFAVRFAADQRDEAARSQGHSDRLAGIGLQCAGGIEDRGGIAGRANLAVCEKAEFGFVEDQDIGKGEQRAVAR